MMDTTDAVLGERDLALARVIADEVTARLANATPALLTDQEAGELLRVPARWVASEARAGRVPSVKIGHYRRFDRDSLLAWVDARISGPRHNGAKR